MFRAWPVALLLCACASKEDDDGSSPSPSETGDTAASCPPPPEPQLPRDRDVAEVPPFVVRSVPAHMDMEVDPALTFLEVTFSKDMGGGFAWLSLGELSPALGEAEWVDARTNRVPVTLQPETTYALQLNGGSYYSFQSVDGEPALPFAWVFRTRALE